MRKQWMTLVAAGVVALGLSLPVAAQEQGTPTTTKPGTAAPGKPGKPRKPGKPGTGKPGARGVKAVEAALAKLDLTPEQKGKTEALIGDTQAQAKAIRKGGGDPAEKRAKQKELNQGFMTKLNAILTTEQQAKLKSTLAEARKNAGPRQPKKPNTN